MRKFFSLIAAVLFAGSMMAQVTIDYANAGYDNNTPLDGVAVAQDGVTITLAKGSGTTAPAYYSTGTGARTYGGNTITVDAGTATITNITFDFSQNNKDYTVNEGTYTKANSEWTGSASSVLFTTESGSGHNRIKSITVTLGGVTPPAVATPVISGDIEFTDSVIVTITCSTTDADIYYTIDGVTDPKCDCAAAPEYTHEIVLKETTTIMAAAYTGNDWSEVATKTFTKKEPAVLVQYEVAEAIAAGLTDGTEIEVRGIITKMEAKGKNFAQYGSVNVYVADATGAEGVFEFYNCYSMQADTFKTTVPAYDATSTAWTQFTEVADAKGYTLHVGDTVIAHGNYKLFNTTHELNTGCYIVYAKVPGALYPTNIENAATEQKTIKFFENGQLFINKNGVIYNAQGTIVR